MFFLTGLFERPSIVWVLRAKVGRYVWTFQHMNTYEMATALPHVAVPTLIIRGTRDHLIPQAWLERIH